MIDWASLAEWAKEQPMKNYRFAICERDNNNKTPEGKLLQYNAYVCVLIAFQICSIYVQIYTYQDLFTKFTVRSN